MTDVLVGLKNFYLDEASADVHFSFDYGNNNTIRVAAHKILLAAGSDAFKAMFFDDLSENGDVCIVDASDAAFKDFLQFFYFNEKDIQLTVENIACVLHLGNKYLVTHCIATCVEYLKKSLTVDTVLIGLHLATLYNQQDLLKLCDEIISMNASNVFKTTAFLQCDQHALSHILDMDALSCSEDKVFEACMEWIGAKTEQNTISKAMMKEHHGSDLINKIRFGSMSFEMLIKLESKYKEVLEDCFVSIGLIILKSDEEKAKSGFKLRKPT